MGRSRHLSATPTDKMGHGGSTWEVKTLGEVRKQVFLLLSTQSVTHTRAPACTKISWEGLALPASPRRRAELRVRFRAHPSAFSHRHNIPPVLFGDNTLRTYTHARTHAHTHTHTRKH